MAVSSDRGSDHRPLLIKSLHYGLANLSDQDPARLMMHTDNSARIVPLDMIGDEEVGGKARGLADLIQLGLAVPRGFVILDAGENRLPEDLAQHYAALGAGLVAVRSSALGEDSIDASFAGQYETLLNIEGLDALQEAIHRCLRSLHNARANAYQQEHADTDASRMCVVVQQMVNARAAGVLFTADPFSARRDRLVIDAVRGLGESLVSGSSSPDHFVLDINNRICARELADPANNQQACVTESELRTLAEQALSAKHNFNLSAGHHREDGPVDPLELDLEWAIDQHGELFWLQARPITTLPADLNELDTPIADTEVITTSNISEMMPGAVCPLTFSFTFGSIEHGFQSQDVELGNLADYEPRFLQTNMFFGHGFLNLSGQVAGGANMLGMDAETAGHAICGRPIPELTAPPKKPFIRRLLGTIRFLLYLRPVDRIVNQFEQRVQRHFRIESRNDAASMAQQLDHKFHWINEMEEVHVRSSTSSAMAEALLQNFYCGRSTPSQEQLGTLARLARGADGVVSAMMLNNLDTMVDAIAARDEARIQFQQARAEDALAWLGEQPALADQFKEFLIEHGHRSYRELCVRQKGWAEDPLPLIKSMQSSIAARFTQAATHTRADEAVDLKQFGRGVRFILPYVHRGAARRERTKSLLAYITREFGKAYRYLGQLLVAEGRLPDEDLVFFFTHDELVAFSQKPSSQWTQHAIKRREALAYQDKLLMPEISVGKPEPVEITEGTADADHLYGRPVSHGVVEGRCRVAHSPEQATALQPGEILIAPITDVAWTPYFSLISGLATDIGSSISHGAVVAREYGLPAIVNLRSATRTFSTGDYVRLDADSGCLSRIDPP